MIEALEIPFCLFMALWSRISSRPIAQACSVVHLPAFFSDDDIASVLALRKAHEDAYGRAPLVREGWRTTYLNAGGLFEEREPALYSRLRELPARVDRSLFFADEAARLRDGPAVDALLSPSDSASGNDGLQVRCAELHDVRAGGALGDPGHFDGGSVVTVDVMLSDDFEGGAFLTREFEAPSPPPPEPQDDSDYSVVAGGSGGGSPTTRMEAHLFAKGDALVFPSHKYHTIAPVTRGRRQVLVLEFWRGDARPCNHRCEVESGPCDGHGRPLSDDAASLLLHLEN